MITQVLELATRFVKKQGPDAHERDGPNSKRLVLAGPGGRSGPLTTLAMMTPSRSGNSS